MTAMERWLAPGILIGIALLQLALANFGTLTPWKGGGFGMFASTDSLGSRVVVCEGVTTDGESIRVNAFAGLNPAMVDGWQAMPREGILVRLGQDLLRSDLIQVGSRRDAGREQFLAQNPELRNEIERDQSQRKPMFRPLSASDPAVAEADVI